MRVHEALARLPSDRRALLVLHYLHDLSLAEIASTLRIPIGTVKSRLHAARAQLKSALNHDAPTEDALTKKGESHVRTRKLDPRCTEIEPSR